jgi:hypothetical protein
MTTISLITPSLARDFEACRLLCETIDAYVDGFDRHYVVVSAEDLPLFRPLAGPRREIVAEETLLPRSLRRLPLRWRKRTYRWAPGLRPIHGWHVQQLLKFAMATAQPNPRVMFIDSDNCFCRPFDLQDFAGGAVPLHVAHADVAAGTPHALWIENAYRLLGLPSPDFPADDFIGQMIVWDAAIVRTLLARIEAIAGESWWKAMCRRRQFSEYMIYGAAVTADPILLQQHRLVEQSPCHSYWSGPPLDEGTMAQFLAGMRPGQSAIGIQSFTRTPIELIRAAALTPRVMA